jgi:hypothetical protein
MTILLVDAEIVNVFIEVVVAIPIQVIKSLRRGL